MSELFDCSIYNMSLHLKSMVNDNELDKELVIEESSSTASDGNK